MINPFKETLQSKMIKHIQYVRDSEPLKCKVRTPTLKGKFVWGIRRSRHYFMNTNPCGEIELIPTQPLFLTYK